jgi:hypothetical protein
LSLSRSPLRRRVPAGALDLLLLAGGLVGIAWFMWTAERLPILDPLEYRYYANSFWHHHPGDPWFPAEYPPLALAIFGLTLLPLLPFQVMFAIWMGLVVAVGYALVARYAGRKRAFAYAVYVLVAGAGTVLARYDIIPAVLTLGALIAAERRRYVWACALLALGALLKVYPLVCLPLVLVAQYRAEVAQQRVVGWPALARQWGVEVGTFLGMVATVMVVPLLVSPSAALSFVRVGSLRPTQIESVPATVLWVATRVLQAPYPTAKTYHSLNVFAAGEPVVRWLGVALFIAGWALVAWRQRRGQLTLGQAWLAAVALFVATNKILSPQYILWIVPLAAYVLGWDVLWLAVCALTVILWPVVWQTDQLSTTLLPHNPLFLLTIAARNVALVVATVYAVRGARVWPVLEPAANPPARTRAGKPNVNQRGARTGSPGNVRRARPPRMMALPHRRRGGRGGTR